MSYNKVHGIRLYEYWHEQVHEVKIRKKRWNNKEIKKSPVIENKFVNRKLEKGGW